MPKMCSFQQVHSVYFQYQRNISLSILEFYQAAATVTKNTLFVFIYICYLPIFNHHFPNKFSRLNHKLEEEGKNETRRIIKEWELCERRRIKKIWRKNIKFKHWLVISKEKKNSAYAKELNLIKSFRFVFFVFKTA